ncbi:MAG: hypothetical protein HY343_08220 [Lentisphaerae bacterium]|nr:hypothetical protein [Lentisphaerota bacterium]
MKLFRGVAALLLLAGLLWPWPGQAANVNEQLKISGFGIFSWSTTDQDDAIDRVDFHPIYLNFDFHPDEQIRALLEFEYEHLPTVTEDEAEGEITVARGFIEYNANDHVNVQAGKFFLPAGLWAPVHWRLLTPSYDRPIFFENQAYYFPYKQVGLNFFGQHELGDKALAHYSGWWTLGGDNSGTGSDADTKFDNVGGNLDLTFGELVTLGSAYQRINATEDFTRDQNSALFFGRANLFDEKLILSSEYVLSDPQPAFGNTNRYQDVAAVYVGAEYRFRPNWSLYYRYDIGDDMKRNGASAPLEGADLDTRINTATLSWWPFAGTRLSLEAIDYDLPTGEDYRKYMVWVGQLF